MKSTKNNLCRALLAGWLAAFIIFGIASITKYPPVNYNLADEIWAMNSSVSFVEGKYNVGAVTPWLYFASLGAFQKIAGEGVVQARLFSLVMALVVLYITYLLGRDLMDEYAGLAASVLLGTTFAFTWHSGVIRNEMMTTAFVTAAVYLIYHAFKRGKNWPVFLGSLVAALAVVVHPNSLQHAVAIIPVYAAIFRKKAASRASLYFLGGLLAGFGVWLGFSYLPAASVEGRTINVLSGISQVSPFPVFRENFFELLFASIKRLPADYAQYVRLYDIFYPNVISVYALAVAVLCVWGLSMLGAQRRRVATIVGLVVMTNLITYFITSRYGFWHMIELFPFLAVATALGLRGLSEMLPAKARTAAFAVAVLAIAGIGVADTAGAYMKVKDYEYVSFIRRVTEKVDGRTMAMDVYAPAVGKDEFQSAWFNTDVPYSDCPPFGKRVEGLGVRYIIIDDVFLSVVRRACGDIYEKDMMRYLNLHCEAVESLNEKYPSYWAPGRMITGEYVYKVPEPALQSPE